MKLEEVEAVVSKRSRFSWLWYYSITYIETTGALLLGDRMRTRTVSGGAFSERGATAQITRRHFEITGTNDVTIKQVASWGSEQ